MISDRECFGEFDAKLDMCLACQCAEECIEKKRRIVESCLPPHEYIQQYITPKTEDE